MSACGDVPQANPLMVVKRLHVIRTQHTVVNANVINRPLKLIR
jgi:hypothetical protein